MPKVTEASLPSAGPEAERIAEEKVEMKQEKLSRKSFPSLTQLVAWAEADRFLELPSGTVFFNSSADR